MSGCDLLPPFGPVLPELTETYPLTAEVPDRTDVQSQVTAARAVARLAEQRPVASITLVHAGWPPAALDRVPSTVTTLDGSGT